MELRVIRDITIREVGLYPLVRLINKCSEAITMKSLQLIGANFVELETNIESNESLHIYKSYETWVNVIPTKKHNRATINHRRNLFKGGGSALMGFTSFARRSISLLESIFNLHNFFQT